MNQSFATRDVQHCVAALDRVTYSDATAERQVTVIQAAYLGWFREIIPPI
jgi:hypothetical protein